MTARPTHWRRWGVGMLAALAGLMLNAATPPPTGGPLWVDAARPVTLVSASDPGATGSSPAVVAVSPKVYIAPGTTPAGYVALSAFGILPVVGAGDDTVLNYNVPSFLFGGQTYTRIGFSSNGYAVVGGAGGGDNSFVNQHLPNNARPNNVLAPYWTDLNPGAAGALRIGTLTDGVDSWMVLDWEGVREYATGANTHSFQIWIGRVGNSNPGEDISFTYGPNTGNGDGGFLTVGAENLTGTSGQMTYVDGTGTLPVNGTQLRVTTDPSPEIYLPLVLR